MRCSIHACARMGSLQQNGDEKTTKFHGDSQRLSLDILTEEWRIDQLTRCTRCRSISSISLTASERSRPSNAHVYVCKCGKHVLLREALSALIERQAMISNLGRGHSLIIVIP